MGKSKQTKEKKFDRNVEISAPILDPEIIKAIHSPPRGHRLVDVKNGGFKALLADLNSQDSTDEMAPLTDKHLPSYIGISCAVSGYTNYSPFSHRARHEPGDRLEVSDVRKSMRSKSPVLHRHEPQVNHVTIDRHKVADIDEERKELTQKLTASAQDRRRSPSPCCIPPTEDDRHHGAYVGARYFPMPDPSKEVHKHIPLLGIDDETRTDDDQLAVEEKKVEQGIASLYGEQMVEGWRETMAHKAKKELPSADQAHAANHEPLKSPKELVTLKPTPQAQPRKPTDEDTAPAAVPSAKVLGSVDKQFLNRLLTDEHPPVPSPSPELIAIEAAQAARRSGGGTPVKQQAPPETPPKSPSRANANSTIDYHQTPPPQMSPPPASSPTPVSSPEPPPPQQQHAPSPSPSPSPPQPASPTKSPAPGDPINGSHESLAEADLVMPATQTREEHIQYDIRADSPLPNQSSPVRLAGAPVDAHSATDPHEAGAQNLVTFSPEPQQTNQEPKALNSNLLADEAPEASPADMSSVDFQQPQLSHEERKSLTLEQDGHYFLNLIALEESFLRSQIEEAQSMLAAEGSALDEETVGNVDSAIGKANLLINKKANQFRGLCEANINKSDSDQFATLNDDLAGFWDMLSIQFADVRKSFESIWHDRARRDAARNSNDDIPLQQ